ncbi:alpha/beta fold hydrolase [Enhydrobacter sp.]|uniref:alpha/beta fold hydrolase n=1 Tax=Enhydrobacter sp. TaxID=1894999 RepID=UPI00263382F6|nr:alpha/beta fold hydrolase [Enhydrobacter sp.]
MLLPMKGAREYLLVRGLNREAPVAIFLHGGPGGSETAPMRLYNAPLEDHLTMAYWDQRGTGRSYDPNIPPETMTIPQFVDDLDQVVDYLRKRLGQQRVWLIGHSWGSALGMLYARRNAAKVAGYIGTGQVASNPQDEVHAYRFVLDEARRRGDRAALARLGKIGPPPYTFDRLMVRDRLLEEYGGVFHRPPDKWRIVFEALSEVPEAGIGDLYRLWRGIEFSQRALWPSFARLDLTETVPALDVPVTFVLGRFDQRTSSPLAVAYLEALRAPSKRLIWLENSAHNGPFEEPAAFRAAVIDAIF